MLPIVICAAVAICVIDLFRLHKAQSTAAVDANGAAATANYDKGPVVRRLCLYALAVFAIYNFGGWLSYL